MMWCHHSGRCANRLARRVAVAATAATTTSPRKTTIVAAAAALVRRSSSSSSSAAAAPSSSFAVVHHAEAYELAMRGLHGQQLALAKREGEGKDDPDFDPFIEEEMEEARLLAEQEKAATASATAEGKKPDDDKVDNDDDDDDDGDDNEGIEGGTSYFSSFDHVKYRNDGFLRRNASETAILQAGAPAGGQVAVIQLAGTQFKVTVDDIVICNRLYPPHIYSVGSVHTLHGGKGDHDNRGDVLLVSNTAVSLVGMPSVQGATVTFMVEEITRDAKLTIFHRRKKGLRRKAGFRRDVTMLRIIDITLPAPYDAVPYRVRPEPAPLVVNRRTRRIVGPAAVAAAQAQQQQG